MTRPGEVQPERRPQGRELVQPGGAVDASVVPDGLGSATSKAAWLQ